MKLGIWLPGVELRSLWSHHKLFSHGAITPNLMLILHCADIDECDDTCPLNSSCTNTIGSYFCTCHPGFASSNGQLNFKDLEVTCEGEQRISQMVWGVHFSLFLWISLCIWFLLQILMSAPKIHYNVDWILSAPMYQAPTSVAASLTFKWIQKAPKDMETSTAKVMS